MFAFSVVFGLVGAGLAVNYMLPNCVVIEGQPQPWFQPNRVGMLIGSPIGTVLGFLFGMMRQNFAQARLED
jgi:hypothetical protein